MDLERSLRSIRSLADLPRLVAVLGHQPLWEEVPDQAWIHRPHAELKVTAVGQTGDFPWFGIASTTPEHDAVALARRISRRGRVGAVLALHPSAHTLVISVAFERIPHLKCELAHPDPEALASLSRLALVPEGGSLAFAAMAADALSAETVGHRFFREFRLTLDRMAAGLPGPMHADDRHGLALLQLTRVLFLYFIQSKGWLAGRERFLAQEVDRCLSRGRRIQRDLLRPLFFGTLNRPIPERSRAATGLGAIPFLNGGLFEPHALERRFRSDIPNHLWRDAFDRLFERFHFTVIEGDRQGGVAPDMLGRVFEGLMAPDVRRASGTFYTPAALVERVLDAALVPLVASKLRCNESKAELRIRNGDEAAAGVLSSLTVLDPAVGSGAFLLGALDRLSSVAPRPLESAARKRRVLQRNLFGVDLNTAAVRLTELRLWLAVVADDPADRADGVRPLPNLDCLIRQGDSLFDPVGIHLDRGASHGRAKLVAELSSLRQGAVTATGGYKRSLIRRLRDLELRALVDSLDGAEAGHQSAIRDCLDQARAGDLFGQRRGLDQELRGRLEELRAALRRLRQVLRRVRREGELPWFHYQTHFADVFSRGGFDLVIGNPPWLRSEAIPAEMRKLLRSRYRWWRPRGRCYGNSPDLAVAFLERALELAGPAGVVAMLVPAKVITAGYGAVARHALASTTTLHRVADLTSDAGAVFEATVYPLALIASKTAPPKGHRVAAALGQASKRTVRQDDLRGGGPWVLQRSGVGRVLAGLEREHPKLGDSITAHLGLKTGLNRVFLNPPGELESEVLRWAVRGRDLKPFRCDTRLRLLWTHDAAGRPRPELPSRAKAYLLKYESELRARRDFEGGPPWAVFRARTAVARYRVVWADLARRLRAASLTTSRDRERIPLNSCYAAAVGTAEEADALAAWLNSTWVGLVARHGAVPASGGFVRFNAQVVARLPFPASASSDVRLARLGRAARSGKEIQSDLDTIVAQHLRLSSSAQSTLRATVVESTRHCR